MSVYLLLEVQKTREFSVTGRTVNILHNAWLQRLLLQALSACRRSSNHPFCVRCALTALPKPSMASYLVKRFRQRELAAVLKTLPSAPTKGEPFKVPNPFIPRKNPVTGRWAPPKYSRRRQADLIKAAKATNTLHLLPRGPKMGLTELHEAVKAVPRAERPLESRTAPWSRYVSWTGKAKHKSVKGAEVGNRLYAGRKRMFKGHKWQRTMERRLGRRNMLVRSMKRRIIRFKSVSTYPCLSTKWFTDTGTCRFTSADVLALWRVQGFLPRCPSYPSKSILRRNVFKLLRPHCLRIHSFILVRYIFALIQVRVKSTSCSHV